MNDDASNYIHWQNVQTLSIEGNQKYPHTSLTRAGLFQSGGAEETVGSSKVSHTSSSLNFKSQPEVMAYQDIIIRYQRRKYRKMIWSFNMADQQISRFELE
jgi:hypothetical protein